MSLNPKSKYSNGSIPYRSRQHQLTLNRSGIVKEAAIETVYSKEIEELKSQLPNLLLTELQYTFPFE